MLRYFTQIELNTLLVESFISNHRNLNGLVVHSLKDLVCKTVCNQVRAFTNFVNNHRVCNAAQASDLRTLQPDFFGVEKTYSYVINLLPMFVL